MNDSAESYSKQKDHGKGPNLPPHLTLRSQQVTKLLG